MNSDELDEDEDEEEDGGHDEMTEDENNGHEDMDQHENDGPGDTEQQDRIAEHEFFNANGGDNWDPEWLEGGNDKYYGDYGPMDYDEVDEDEDEGDGNDDMDQHGNNRHDDMDQQARLAEHEFFNANGGHNWDPEWLEGGNDKYYGDYGPCHCDEIEEDEDE